MWDPVVKNNALGRFSLDTVDTLQSPQSQEVVFESGVGEIGISNEGLNHWGMGLRAGKIYEGVAWVKCPKKTTLWLTLESKDGKKRYAETSVKVKGGDWTKVSYRMTPNQTDPHGKLVVSLREPGSVKLGYILLQPGVWGRFNGQPVRKDVAKGLVDEGLTVLRLGGCMVNHSQYLWKNMVGPRDLRAAYAGFWYPFSSYGWGIFEFLNFCEKANIVGIPDIHMGEKPEDMADFMEYVNGSARSKWGGQRVKDGHPEPYHLKYLQLGNEEAVDEAYWTKFKPMAEAIWSKVPSVQLVVGDFAYNDAIENPYDFLGGAQVRSLEYQKKIVDFANEKGKSVWFDLHISNDNPNQPDLKEGGIIGVRTYIEALKKICPGKDFRVVVFEENAGNHTMRRGLGHAHAINEILRMADDVVMLCAANCLQCDKQNDNNWDQGLLFLSPMNVWGQPSYYVTQMVSHSYLPVCVDAKIEGPQDVLDVTATRSDDGRIIQLQVVNMKDQPVDGNIAFGKWVPKGSQYKVEWIAGDLSDKNTEENPKNVVSHKAKKTLKSADGVLSHRFPAYSFSILRFENK
jgi:alpha-L-arabinofuranosidase